MNKFWTNDAKFLLATNLVLLFAHLLTLPYMPATITWLVFNEAYVVNGVILTLMIPLATLAGSLGLWWVFVSDTQPFGLERNHKIYRWFITLLVLGFDSVSIITLLNYQGVILPTDQVIVVVVGLVLLLIGNIMPKIKPNYVFGVRNPFTLADDVVWIKTHQMTGYVNAFGGLLIMMTVLVPPTLKWWIIIPVGVIILSSPFIYSYRKYQQIKTRKKQENVED